jgi:hypothetical protein
MSILILKSRKRHLSEIEIVGNSFHLIHKEEWKEREHNTLDVNRFIQFIDQDGKLSKNHQILKIRLYL